MPIGYILLYPLGLVINGVRDLSERLFITKETKKEQRNRRSEEIWDSTSRFVYLNKGQSDYKRGELGQFDLWGEVVHKYEMLVNEKGDVYFGCVKSKTHAYYTVEEFEEMWEQAK
jgi:hypothetical protein